MKNTNLSLKINENNPEKYIMFYHFNYYYNKYEYNVYLYNYTYSSHLLCDFIVFFDF